MTSLRLAEIAEYLNAELIGDPDLVIQSIAPLDKAVNNQLSFFTDSRFKPHLKTTNAAAVMLKPEHQDLCKTNKLILADPYLGFAKIAKRFAPKTEIAYGIHANAITGEECKFARTVSIAANVVIGNNVEIGEHTIIHPNVVIGDDTKIGNNCILYPNVTVYHAVKIADRVILHSGVVIGADGFGLANDQGRWEKIPQLGGVIIEDDVEVGANTTIDRGALENTHIGQGVKIDNQVQIAHNVKIGAHTAIAGCSAIAGSCTIGKHCILAGKVGVADHVTVTDQVILTANSNISSDIRTPGIYCGGLPSMPHKRYRRNVARYLNLEKMAKRIQSLEKKLLGE